MSKNLQQTKHHFSYTIEIDSSLEKTWEYLTDVTKWTNWDTELKSAKLLGDFELGTKGKLTPKKGPELDFFISELVPFQSYAFNTEMPLGHLVIRRTLESKELMTYFTDDIRFTGPLKRLYGLLLGGGFKKVLPKVMGNFKRLVEKV
ncbi:polyketide cyclase [Flavobacteriaceae bacterium TP-CH-4]|uniref:Polyketide cyclase n=1 Tax=Pelagihabitans pacificus TaxID=2696054 RepID=A0A967B0D7_9FLAO|nr:SRPBCC family protein [Pelagihabitans pacificus]NHF59831.1 polyketide cyclase [Pelagihabitans pacificus]